MKKRSNFAVMKNLIHLVKPLTDYMILAILMGLLGHLCASFITIFGAFGILQVLGMWKGSLGFLFIGVAVFAVLRGILRYAEQSCNHFIAFKLLALIRDEVFQSLRKLTPAKLEGKLNCSKSFMHIPSHRRRSQYSIRFFCVCLSDSFM